MRKDWIECKLGDLLKLKNGFAFKSNKYLTDGTPVIRIGDINDWLVSETYAKRVEDNKLYDDYIVENGDILIAMSGATTGKFGIYKSQVKAYQNQRVGNLKPYSNKYIDKSFIFYLLYALKRNIEKDAYGGAQPNISASKIEALAINFIPLPEQRTIVAKIEQLFSELDNAIANLKTSQEQLKVYRQAVLKKAFEGELTKEWREKQRNLLTAEELLKLIQNEREKHYKQQVNKWKEAVKIWENNGKVGKKPSSITKVKTLPTVSLEEIKLYEILPSSWCWTRMCNVTYKIGDIDHKMPKDYPNGLPYLSTGNLKKDGTIDFQNAKTISVDDFKRLSLKIKPEKGDIIFPRYGTIGRNFLIDFDKDFLVSYSCAIIKNIPHLMNVKFVYYYTLSPVIQKEIQRYIVETTQANIGIASIENFIYPLCSNEEQHQIVQEIESRLSICDKVEQTIQESLLKAEALRQSILKQAFEGKLLTKQELATCKQQPDWEPASKLLERVKKEKLLKK